MLMIRLQRVGKRNNPAFRVVLTDKRNATKSGNFLEILGSYNPQHDGSLALKKDRISHWLSKGVQPSDTMHNLLVREKIIDAPKRHVVAPSKLKKLEAAASQSGASPATEGREKPAEAFTTEAPIESASEQSTETAAQVEDSAEKKE